MRRIALYIVMGMLPQEISKEIRVHTKSIRKILVRDDFAPIYQEVESNVYGALERRVKHLMVVAVKRLEKLIKSPNAQVAGLNIDRALRLSGIRIDEVKLPVGTLKRIADESSTPIETNQERLSTDAVKHAMGYLKATNGIMN